MKIEGRKEITRYLRRAVVLEPGTGLSQHSQLTPIPPANPHPLSARSEFFLPHWTFSHSQIDPASRTALREGGRWSYTSRTEASDGQTVGVILPDPLSANSVWPLPRPNKYCCANRAPYCSNEYSEVTLPRSMRISLRGCSVEGAPSGTHPTDFAPHVRDDQLPSP